MLHNGAPPQETTPIDGEWNFNARDGDVIDFRMELTGWWCHSPAYLLVRVEVWDAHDGRRCERIVWMEHKDQDER